MQRIGIEARWDDEARVWWCDSPDVPGLTTEAATLDALAERVGAVLPDLITVEPGAVLGLHASREQPVAMPA